jgi:hypothetical protein
MPTQDQVFAVVACLVAGIAIFVVGRIAIAVFAALGRALTALFTAVKGVLITALVGGVIVAIAAVALLGTGVVTIPTASPAPTATPRPTAVRAVEQLDIELETMSILKAQRYGAGFRFRNDADNAVCVLQYQTGQDWLVANCD